MGDWRHAVKDQICQAHKFEFHSQDNEESVKIKGWTQSVFAYSKHYSNYWLPWLIKTQGWLKNQLRKENQKSDIAKALHWSSLLIGSSWMSALTFPTAGGLSSLLAEDVRRCLISQHVCHRCMGGLWLALLGPITLLLWYEMVDWVSKNSFQRMGRQAVRTVADRRKVKSPELMHW